ncbi:MAG: hypothetical protein CMJ20_12295 [Phycisphaeraceae bacterium]|nr:hypothetical protein [Phycisphaeraceae bacterium]
MAFLLLSIIGAVIACVAYKASSESDCRRLQHLLVERFITTVGFICIGFALGGMQVNFEVVCLGLVAGLCLFVARVALLKMLETGQAPVIFTFWNMSLVIPVLLSIFLWHEKPAMWRIIGLILMPMCFLLLGEHVTRNKNWHQEHPLWKRLFPILLCVLGEGVFSTCFKMVDVYHLVESRNLFLVLFNLFTLVALVLTTCIQGEVPPRRWEYTYGALSGSGFIIAGAFGIIAVLRVPGTVFFPVVAAGSLVMTLFVTHLIWRQKISMTQKIGIGLSIVEIVLISMV